MVQDSLARTSSRSFLPTATPFVGKNIRDHLPVQVITKLCSTVRPGKAESFKNTYLNAGDSLQLVEVSDIIEGYDEVEVKRTL